MWIWIGLGDLWRTTGSLERAAEAYQNALRAAQRTGDERDLSVSQNKIGEVLVAQGEREQALAAYRAGLEIRETLARRDPGNTQWQRDLSITHERIGEVLWRRRARAGVAAYRAGLEIRETLARRDPGNTQWQRDLIVSCVKISATDPSEATACLKKALEIAHTLEASGRLAPVDGWMPAERSRRVSLLEK